jgi:general stress protein CsbA
MNAYSISLLSHTTTAKYSCILIVSSHIYGRTSSYFFSQIDVSNLHCGITGAELLTELQSRSSNYSRAENDTVLLFAISPRELYATADDNSLSLEVCTSLSDPLSSSQLSLSTSSSSCLLLQAHHGQWTHACLGEMLYLVAPTIHRV